MAFDVNKKVNFFLALSGEDKVKAAMRGVTEGMWSTEKAAGLAQKAFVGLIGIGSIAAFAGIVKGGIDAAAGLHDLSLQTGLSVAALTQFKYIGDLSGTSAEAVAGAANKLGKSLALTNDEGKGAGLALKALGIDFDTFRKMSPDEQMLTVAKAMAGFKDGTDKSAAAMLLYGKEGAKLLPFLGDLAEQHDQVIEKLTEEEVALRKTEAAMADAFGDNLVKIRKDSNDWKKDLSLGLLPALYEASEAVLGMGRGTGGLKDQISQLARDGTLADWARGAMTAFSYLLDVGQGLFSLIPMLGKVIAGVAAGTSALFGGIFAAMEQLKSGNITGAWAALKGGFEGVRTVAAETGTDIANIWGQKLLGQTFRDRMGDLKGTSVAAEGTKKSMDGLADVAKRLEDQKKRDEKASKEAEAAQKKLTEEYERAVKAGQDLIDGIAKKNTAMQFELDMGRKLTKVEEDLLDIEEQLRRGKILLNREEHALAREEIERGRVLEANIRWMNDSKKANDAYFEGLQKTTEALEEETRKQAEANHAALLGKDAMAQLESAKLRDRAASLDRRAELALDIDFSGALTQEFRDQAVALRQLADLKDQGVHIAAARESADEWKKTTDSIGQGLTDSLFRAFESGRDFFSTFWQGIKNLFKTTVLKLLIQPVQGAINGLVGSVLGGLGGAANAAGGAGGVGDMLGLAGAVGSLAGGGGILGFAGDVFGSAIGAGTSGVGAASGLAGSIGSAIAAVPVWGWIAGGLALVAASLDKSGTPHLGGTVMADASGARQISGDLMGWRNQNVAAETVTALKALSGGLVGTLNGLAGAFGQKADFGINAGFAADNTDPSWGYLGILRGSQAVGGWSGNGDVWGRRDYATDGKKGYEQYLVDVAAATRAAIASIGLPEWAQKTFDALGGAPTLEQLAQAAQQIAAVQTALTQVGDLMAPLGGVFGRVAMLSGDATLQLAGFAGGMDALISKTKSYVEAYYSEAEKAGIQAVAIRTALEQAGLSTDIGSRDALRALVDTRDVATEEGRRQLAALLDVAGSFASLADYLGKTGQTLSSLADTAPQVALLDQATQQADRLVAVNDSVMTIGEQITTAVASAQASAEAGFAAVAANTATLTRLLERFDDGDALTVRIAA